MHPTHSTLKKISTYAFIFVVVLLGGQLLTSCVTARRHERLQAQYNALAADTVRLAQERRSFGEDRRRLQAQIDQLTAETTKLKADSAESGTLYRRNKALLDDLFEKYERLDKSYNQLLSNSSVEAGRLASNLSEKEKQLLTMEQNLLTSKAQVDKLNVDLQAREQRVQELEKILADKEKAVNDLRTRVSNALLGFKEGDLTVDIRNGKVYVSLAEQLLFKSGSYSVDPRGVDALKKLANVLKSQQDVNVLVEGHTDDVPIAGSINGVKNNWDLSVMRATSIVDVLVKNGVNPGKLTAAGRGEFVPVAQGKTPEARQKNRRTEIILTPNLDELFQLLGSN
ncbi:MAG: OmpA domain protein [uncultured Cytophagales bacterium]|uniref:OmpA domain protein n=1 Tax=uncultured Cytophagales bacterium TaxID=158755 RepID=A0A6J4I5Z4_9SPHI|nr:MAG: OmpA domain protein [uncultured Cytophagales bacterium]